MESIYNQYLHIAFARYYSDEDFIKCYNRVPKQRDYTFKYCMDYFKDRGVLNILELGTSRSFVDGSFPGACNPDIRYWDPEAMDKWDWSAGIFTNYSCYSA